MKPERVQYGLVSNMKPERVQYGLTGGLTVHAGEPFQAQLVITVPVFVTVIPMLPEDE